MMEFRGVEITGKDLIALVALVFAFVGLFTATIPTNVALAIIAGILSIYFGINIGQGVSKRMRQKR